MKLKITFFTILLASSAFGNQMSKELKLENSLRVVLRNQNFDDKLDAYNRDLCSTENESQLNSILTQMSTLGKNKDQRKEVLVTLCERYLEYTPLSTLPALQIVISDLLPQYINEHIDAYYKTVNDHQTLKGVALNYRKMVIMLLPSNPVIAAATFKQGYLFLVNFGASTQAEQFLSEIYTANPIHADIAAVYCENLCWKLIKQRKSKQLLEALDTCSTLERVEVNPTHYYVRAVIHLHKKDYPQALNYARTALSFDSSSLYKKFVATMLTFNGQYDEAIPYYQAVVKAGDYNDGLLEIELLQALQLAGRDDEVAYLLLNEFTHIRKHLEHLNQPAKASITPEAKNKQSAVSAKQKVTVQKQPTLKIKEHAEFSSDHVSPHEFVSTTVPEKSLKKEILDREKERPKKIKRKGTPNPDFEQDQEAKELIAPQIPQITVEELLGKNSHHYKTFCNFFSYLEDDTKLSSVHITMKQAQQLLKFFGEVDRSKGKGSHTKATLSIEATVSEAEQPSEIMLILSNKSKLLPYQILMIRDAFLELGFYPKDLKDTLIKKQLLSENK